MHLHGLNAARAVLLLSVLVSDVSALSCDVTGRGAVGDGQIDDTAVLQQTLDDPACDEVLLPSGKSFASSVLRVARSNVALTIEGGATLLGLPDKIKRPECNGTIEPEWRWQDWCAFIKVTSESNFTLRGSGTLAPGGVGGKDPDFYSALHVLSTVGVELSGVRVHCTAWWWCTALHNATDVRVSNFFVDGSNGRDGMDFVNCRRVLVEDSRIEGSDDGLCFKTISEKGLSNFPASDVVVRRSRLSSKWCNALQFGSATEVDMWNFTFQDVVIESARKAAIGIVSMDSANISGISFHNITIRGANVSSPLYVKLGHRVNGENGESFFPVPGTIADVDFYDLVAEDWGYAEDVKPGHSSSYTATIEGINASYRVGPIRFHGLSLTAPGGGNAEQSLVDPPISPLMYQPRYTGVRPSWGLFTRHALGVVVTDASFRVAAPDERPAIISDDVTGKHDFSGDVSGGATCQIQLRNVSSAITGSGVTVCDWIPSPPAALHLV